MNRRNRYVKNLNTNQSRNQAPIRRGHQQQFGNNPNYTFNEHDDRTNNRPPRRRPSRAQRSTRNGRSVNREGERVDLRNNIRNNVSSNDETWKITIVHGGKYERDHLFTLLKSNLSDGDDVVFYNFAKVNGSAMFFVVGTDTALALRDLSRRVTTQTGHRLVILATKSPMMTSQLDNDCKETIKQAMARLFDGNNQVMDLSNFRDAIEFKQKGLFVILSKVNMLRTAIEIITENTPNLLALNLRNNKISYLEPLTKLKNSCHNLKALDLSNNNIHNVEEISFLKGLDLVELVLEGNPFIEKFSVQATYISAIRKLFKNLKKLDNEDLPTEIGFDIGVVQNLPETKDSYIPEGAKTFVYGFLELYYKIFDSDNRQPLMQAYHDEAMFTYSYSAANHSSHNRPSEQFMRESHNLLRLRDESLWVKNTKNTKLDIVSFLGKFPHTQHDPESFKIDVPFFEPALAIVVVNGCYTETFKTNKPTRAFCRTFIIVSQGTGHVIINDMMEISTISVKQAVSSRPKPSTSKQNNKNEGMVTEVEFMSDTTIVQPSVSTPTFNITSSTFTPIATASNINPQEEILNKFMQVTNMNRAFSQKCLEENAFNPETAFDVFQKLHLNNKIPAEAFIK